MSHSTAIHSLPNAELMRLAKAIAREDFAAKVSRAALVLAKFGHLEGQLDALIGHDKRAALAIVSAILRERERAPAGHASVAWAGPNPTGQGTREPYNLLLELIATAEHSVLFAGVDLQRDARLLRSLHAAQRGRELQVSVVLAGPDVEYQHRTADLFGRSKPWPALYVPDLERVHVPVPMCLLADHARGVLLAGAAPEVDAPDSHITAGILLQDAVGVASLYAQWQTLIDTGAIVPLTAAESPTA